MSRGHGVSGKTHTRQQLNHYANQHNPNNVAYRAERNNHANQCNPNHSTYRGKHYCERTEFQHESYQNDD